MAASTEYEKTKSLRTNIAKATVAGEGAKSVSNSTTPQAQNPNSIGVKGNIHIPNTNAAEQPVADSLGTPVNGSPVPPTQPSTTPAVTQKVATAPTQEQAFVQQQKYEMPEELKSALQSVDEDVGLLQKFGGSKSAVKEILKTRMTELFTQQTAAATQAELVGETKEQLATRADLTQEVKDSILTGIDTIYTLGTKIKENKAKGLDISADEAEQAKIIGNIAQSMGTTGSDGKVTADWSLIGALLGSTDEAVADIVATGLADHIKVDSTFLKTLGYGVGPDGLLDQNAIDDLFEHLGLSSGSPPTIDEFQQAVNKHLETMFAPLENLLSIKDDGMASPAERAAALAQLKQMGYVGELANATALQNINEDLQTADTNIEFGGKTYDTVDDLLDDENITGLIGTYLDGEVSREDYPELDQLFDIVDNNLPAFKDLREQLHTEVTQFTDIQKSYSTLKDTATSAGITNADEFIKNSGMAYDPNARFYTTAANTGALTGVYKLVLTDTTLTADQKANLGQFESAVRNSGMSLDVAEAVLKNVSDDTLKTLASAEPTVRTAYIDGIKTDAAIDQIRADINAGRDVPPERLLGQIFGAEIPNTAELANTVSMLEELSTMGDEEATQALTFIHGVWDDNPSVMIKNISDITDVGDLTQLSNFTTSLATIRNAFNSANAKKDKHLEFINYLRGGTPTAPIDVAVSVKDLAPDKSIGGIVTFSDKLISTYPTKEGDIVGVVAGEVNKTIPENIGALKTTGITAGEPSAPAIKSGIESLTSVAANAKSTAIMKEATRGLTELYSGLFGTGDSSLDWKAVNNLANSMVGATMNMSLVPDEFKGAFTSEGQMQKIQWPGAGKIYYNPVVQDMMGLFSNYRNVFGSTGDVQTDMSNFFTTMNTAKLLGVPIWGGGIGRGVETTDKALNAVAKAYGNIQIKDVVEAVLEVPAQILSGVGQVADPVLDIVGGIGGAVAGGVGQVAEAVKDVVAPAAKQVSVGNVKKKLKWKR